MDDLNMGEPAETPLSVKILVATQTACNGIFYGKVAAERCGDVYSLWDRWVWWWRGFAAGWVGDILIMPLKTRLWRMLRKW